jgi:hypothetical protein
MFNILIVDDLKVFGAKTLKQQHRSLLSLCVSGQTNDSIQHLIIDTYTAAANKKIKIYL